MTDELLQKQLRRAVEDGKDIGYREALRSVKLCRCKGPKQKMGAAPYDRMHVNCGGFIKKFL